MARPDGAGRPPLFVGVGLFFGAVTRLLTVVDDAGFAFLAENSFAAAIKSSLVAPSFMQFSGKGNSVVKCRNAEATTRTEHTKLHITKISS